MHEISRSSKEVPAYSVRISARAKRMQLKVSSLGKVEVVVPRGLDCRLVPMFVHKHRSWLYRTIARLQKERGEPALNDFLPKQIKLLAVHEGWRVDYVPQSRRAAVSMTQEDGVQVLQVARVDGRELRENLRGWLTERARARLVPQLLRLSRDLELPFNRVTIRSQKTRWGSCSADRGISLNRNLLFLPPKVVRYLLVHELCHTVHMNHSRRFWAMVGRIEPDFQHLDAELREGSRYIPVWAYPE